MIPNLANPQSWNRYSYVMNNPLRFTDPTGHRPCEDGNCEISPLAYHITYDFGWILKGDDWTNKELQAIFVTGNRIKKYIDGKTNGKGKKWMDRYMSGVTIEHRDKPGNSAFPTGAPFTPDGGKIELNRDWVDGGPMGSWPPIQALTHELAHIADCNSGKYLFYQCIGGAADQLNDGIGGDVTDNNVWYCRWCQPSGWPKALDSHIPAEFQWSSTVNFGYGNGSTADYFAEAFSWSVYDSTKLPHSPTVEVLIWVILMNQASTLP